MQILTTNDITVQIPSNIEKKTIQITVRASTQFRFLNNGQVWVGQIEKRD